MYTYNIDFLDEVDSTSLYLKQKATSYPLPDQYAVCAQYQFAGRGQRGNTWESAPFKNLLFSLYVPSPGRVNSLSRLNNAIALVLVQELLARGIRNVKVKWPNDVYVGDRKIAGILTDTVLQKNEVSSAVVGVGLNLNQLIFNTPKATSLAAITGVEWDLVVVLHDIYKRFYYTLEMTNPYLLESVNKLLYKKGESVTFRDSERTLVYIVRAITDFGDLLVETQSGEEKILQHHKIKWIG